MYDREKLEYEQASEDWRHRDSLTWQIPTVLVAAGGVLVAEAVELQEKHPLLANVLITFAFLLAFSLTAALGQNLIIQAKDRKIIESFPPKTKRFEFCKCGSWLLFVLSICMTIFLAVVCVVAWLNKL
jgi:hypothetical protein